MTACAASTKVRGLTTTSVASPPTAPLGDARTRVTIAGVPGSPAVTVTTTLFGPYSSPGEMQLDGCGRVFQRVIQTRQGDGILDSTPINVDQGGYYAWQAETSSGDTWLGSRSPCLGSNTTTFIS